MNAYKNNKTRLENFLQTERGRRFINFAYSIGAAIVILGAMFKLLHLPFGNELLFIGMITEVIVFTISAFDKPVVDYNWDRVFPILTSKDAEGTQNYSQAVYTEMESRSSQTTQEPHSPQVNIAPSNQTEEYNRQMEKLISETEKMGKQLQELNEVYERMLRAMRADRNN